MKRGISICLMLILSLYYTATAQEMSGRVHSNHAGTNVLFFNPAGMHHQKNWLSINIFTMDMFFSNNYAYIPKEDFSFTNLDFPMHKTDYSFGERPFYIYDKGHKTRADLHLKLQGPSVMYIYNQHAFAITSGARAVTTMKNLSPDLGKLIYHGFHYSPQYEDDYPIENFRGSVLTWGEVGVSYAYQHNTRSFGNWNFGVSIRKLYSAGGGYLYLDNSVYNLHNDSTLEFKPLNAEMALSLPIDYNSNELIPGLAVYGKGWGFDVGIEYQELLKRQDKHLHEKVCGQSYNSYKYRWGISITDIGYITFTNNAQLHQYIDVNYLWENIDTVKYDNLNDAVHDISNRFYGNPQASLKDTKFKIWLPTSINASFDYNFENDFYLNSSLVVSAPLMMSNYIEKPAIFSITPRYEKKNIEASLSMNLYQWQYPRVGASLRLYYFTIGSDYLTSFLGVHDFNGLDLYFSFKINIGKGSCTKRNTINPCGDDGKYFPWSK